MIQEKRFDVMLGVNFPCRVMQWATRDEVNAFLLRTGYEIQSECHIGVVLRELTVARPSCA